MKVAAPLLGIIFYAIPAATANTFTITASTTSPVDGSPGPVGDATYKYIGAFLNYSDNNIIEFRQVTRSKFVFIGDYWEINLSGTQTITDHTLQFSPKTAQSIFGNLSITITNSTAASGCTFRLKPTSTASSACTVEARTESAAHAYCEMTLNPTTPSVIYYEIVNWGTGAVDLFVGSDSQ